MRVRIEIEAGVTHVILSRPEKHNGVDWDMLVGWRDAAQRLASDRSTRAVIVRGDGASFCSGLDFAAFLKQPGRSLRAFVPKGATNLAQEACWAWRQVPVPVIAALHGRCYGAGLQLALAADFRISTPDCELSVMEAKWGLIPDMSGTLALRELVGIDQAKLLTMTARRITGTQARDLGLVTEVADPPLLAARALAEELAGRSPDSLAAAKHLLQANWTASEDAALARERRLQAGLLVGRNFRAALSANFGKTTARFRRRRRRIIGR